jgi:hypothetical protein
MGSNREASHLLPRWPRHDVTFFFLLATLTTSSAVELASQIFIARDVLHASAACWPFPGFVFRFTSVSGLDAASDLQMLLAWLCHIYGTYTV